MHQIDRRHAYLECELRACGETSPLFVYELGGEVPKGWVVSKSKRFQSTPGKPGFLCPRHAELETADR